MIKIKERSYIDNTGKKALEDLEKFYGNAKEIILMSSAQMKNHGEFKNVNFEMKTENREISNLHRFYRGAVLPYYIRQREENFDKEWKYTTEHAEKYTNELKEQIGFFIFDDRGKKVGLNSFAVFEETKKYVKTLELMENIAFDNQGFKFPSSEHYKELEKKHGRVNAPAVALSELEVWWNNQMKHE
jgi:hypothetical protein